jgi:hypothetical protein
MCHKQVLGCDWFDDWICHVATAQFLVAPAEDAADLGARTADG